MNLSELFRDQEETGEIQRNLSAYDTPICNPTLFFMQLIYQIKIHAKLSFQ